MNSLAPSSASAPDVQELLETLRLAINDKSAKTFEGLEAIYTFYNQRMKQVIPPTTRAPLFVLVYAIESVTSPAMQWESASDLLALLAQVERERRRYIGLAELNIVRTSNDYAINPATGASHRVDQLTPRDRERLTRMLGKSAGTRVRYRLLVLRIGEAHIRFVRARPEMSHLTATLLGRYFPSKDDAPRRARELAIHSDLSEEEVQQRDAMRAFVTQFIKDAAQYDRLRREYWHKINPDFDPMQNNDYTSYTRDFEAKLGSAFKWEDTHDMLEKYLDRVNSVASTYESMFPNGVYTPAGEDDPKVEA